ncbi:MAG: chemotaxis protein CheA [Desulfobacterales bacterium]|nr:chemotaxis protein CheA [Desulfobacterales bacterium]
MEEYDSLISLTDSMASDFLFIDGKKIDVPDAGKFFNKLNELIKEADSRKIFQLKNVAVGLNSLLEKMVLNEIDDEEAGFNAFEKGIILMQNISESFKNTGGYEGGIEVFEELIPTLMGEQPAAGNEQPATSVVDAQDESLLRDFIIEGIEYIDEIEINILNLEQAPENKDYINNIFRPFHSIKGVASFLNLEQIRGLAHSLETLLDRARSGELVVTSHLIDVILDGADSLKAMIVKLRDDLEGNPAKPLKVDLPALIARIESVSDGEPDVQERKKVGEILVEEGVVTEKVLEQELDVAKQTIPPKKIGEILIAGGKATPKQVSQALRKQADQVMDTAAIRVNIKKLDDLIDMVGEMVITQSMIRQNRIVQSNSDSKLTKNIAQLSSITSELQRTSTSLRMVPIKQTFQRMSRLVRDLAKDAGKTVSVIMEGEDTEIDRNMVDEIYNPLVHMIRNAVDHGIEFPEEQVKLGKTEKGIIQLRAYHRGGNIVIEISDNGKGLDKDSILKKAVEKGIVDGSHDLPDQDIYRLVFHPGLSTAKKVTDISGRGVGMDVVRQAVEKLRGKIEINSVYGKGTTVSARFPLTMAIINGMVVRIGNEKYIIPTTAIRKLLRPARELYNKVIDKGETINIMGKLLPLVRLYNLFGIEPEYKDPWDAVIVVVEGQNRSKCLLVDEIIGGEEVVIKNLGKGLKSVKGVSGGAIMGGGNVGLILDTEGLFELSESLG